MNTLSRRTFCLSSGALCASVATTPATSMAKVLIPMKTGYAFDYDFVSFWNNSAETYLRAEWINSRLILTGVRDELYPIAQYADPMTYIRKIHTQKHIDTIDSYNAGNGFSLKIGQAAKKAAAYVLGAVHAVCTGEVRNAFCCIRPPGHHVQNGGEMGYCCYANIVLAAKLAREQFNLQRILIIDWDYHQGNGTHGFVCGDDDILFFETYNPPMYSTTCDDFITTGPDHVFPTDARRINIRMPSGSTSDDLVRVFESKLVPAAERFKPELVLISCGFDLKKYDSHGSFLVTASGVSRLTRIVRQIADTYAGGKLVSVLEGGYVDSVRDHTVYGTEPTFSGLSQCAENHVKTLISGDEYPETPFYSNTSVHGRYKPQGQPYRTDGLMSGIPANDGPWTVTIADCNGRLVKKTSCSSDAPFHLRELSLPKGYYVISITGKTGHTSRTVHIAQ